jgi:hypothetical protein
VCAGLFARSLLACSFTSTHEQVLAVLEARVAVAAGVRIFGPVLSLLALLEQTFKY